VIVDANLLIYAVDSTGPFHRRANTWLENAINGPRRVAIPTQSIGAFLRLATHPRVVENPLPPQGAAEIVSLWMSAPGVWVPPTSRDTVAILTGLVTDLHLSGNLIADAMLAALAIEHGLTVFSNDSDFARFPDCRWFNPLA
jgi:toxin-antitoxin system PIN domain toxin